MCSFIFCLKFDLDFLWYFLTAATPCRAIFLALGLQQTNRRGGEICLPLHFLAARACSSILGTCECARIPRLTVRAIRPDSLAASARAHNKTLSRCQQVLAAGGGLSASVESAVAAAKSRRYFRHLI